MEEHIIKYKDENGRQVKIVAAEERYAEILRAIAAGLPANDNAKPADAKEVDMADGKGNNTGKDGEKNSQAAEKPKGEKKSVEAGYNAESEGIGECRTIYRGRNRVFTVRCGEETLCVKAFKKPRFPNSVIYTNLRGSKARRSFENALRLLSMGIGTPRPIGYIEVKKGVTLRESYYISEMVEGETMRQWEEKPDNETLLRLFAREMYKLHCNGVLHKDFSPGNALYTRTANGGYRFYFVDLNRMVFDVKSRRKLMRNFRSIHLDAAETERLARIYAEESGRDADEVVREAIEQLENYHRSKRRHKILKRIFKGK